MNNNILQHAYRSLKHVVSRRVWRPHHSQPTHRRWVAVLLAGGFVLPTHAQPTHAADQAPALDAPSVDASHAMAGFRLLENWVHQGAVTGQRPDPLRASRVLGVKVTLRLQGYPLGTGQAWRDDLDAVLQPGAAVGTIDLIPLLEPATFTAFQNARQHLRDTARDALLMAKLRPELKGVGKIPTLQELGREVTIDIQIMHSPTPLALGADEPNGTLLQRFAPGHHGLIARQRSTLPDNDNAPAFTRAAVWPATTIAQNLTPARQLRVLVAELDLPFTATADLGRPGGPRLHRTEVLHVVRPRIDLPPQPMTRGSSNRLHHNPDTEQLHRMADRLAKHLAQRFIGHGYVRGTYHPSSNTYNPPLASSSDAALAAFALTQHATTNTRLHPAALNQHLHQPVDDLIQIIAAELDADADPRVLEPDAAALLTLTRLLRNQNHADPISRRFLAALTPHLNDQGQVLTPPTPQGDAPREASRPAAAIATLALGRHALADDHDDTLALAAAAGARLWQRAPLDDGNTLPWLALIVEEIEPALVAAGHLTPEQLAQHRAQLDAAATRLEDFQIIERPALGPDDVLGGFAIPMPPPTSPPNPTWTTAPLLSFLATTLRLSDAPENDRFGRLITAQYAARFLRRLMFNQDAAFYIPDPTQVLGAVRPALYDNRLSVAPSAMSLIALDQFRQTLHQQKIKQQEPQENSP